MFMRLIPLALLFASTAVEAQEVVEVPASKANVGRPDDLFALPPGQWMMAKSIAQGSDACVSNQCEAGFTSGDLVVSVEHAKDFVRIIAGFKGCEKTAYSEVEVGSKPGKPTFGRVAKQVQQVVKGAAKTCGVTAPSVPKLDVASMFPKAAG
jgi:hypothetical protein